MSIVSSTHSVGHAQADGRRWVVESHTDHLGVEYRADYLAVDGTDYVAIRTARAARIEQRLADTEAAQLIEGGALNFQHQTLAEFAARFWQRVQDADQFDRHRLIWWLIERINAGHITDAQARNSHNTAFGRNLNASQWTTFKTNRLAPMHARWAAFLAEGDL